jgi:hypothetical protein
VAGEFADFDAEAFRDGVIFAYDMGAAPLEEHRPAFYFASELVYTAVADAAGLPFDPDTTVQRIVPPPVRVPCALTYYDAFGEVTNLGMLTPSRVVVDLLDEHYVQVQGAVAVVIAGDRYLYRRTEPPSGLFDVGIFRLHFAAENET